MTTTERMQIMRLATQSISPEQFLTGFRASPDGQQLYETLLSEALHSKCAEDVEYALMVGYTFGFSKAHLQLLLHLLGEPWHFKHEDIVTALGRIKSSEAVEGLYAATQWIPPYLDFDESRALAVKAIWALGSIAGNEAHQCLEKLASDPDAILSSAAKEQLERRRTV